MKIILCCCAMIIALSSQAFGQTTAPAPVDLSYHFRAGTILHYNRLDETRNPENPPGYEEGNWYLKQDIHIAVQKVYKDGSAMLVVKNVETHDLKGGQ